MKLDLHVHTTASDGAWAPRDVVAAAARGGLDVVAITDHDTTSGLGEARTAADGARIHVVPAVEVSTTHREREIHVLGYFVDPDAPCLGRHRERAHRLRAERMKEMLGKLAREGIEVSYEDVKAAAGSEGTTMGRPHLARALVARGYAPSVPEAFGRHIGDDRPAFVPTRLATPAEGVALVLEAGGVPVWAHPPGDLLDELLPALKDGGLAGLEVYRPSTGRTDVLRLEAACRTWDLLVTGGSDWHSPDGGSELGDFYVTADEVQPFLGAGGM